MNFIGKILPVEGYRVLLKGSLPSDYAKSLTHLYQPLIGIQAVSLYQTLLHEFDLQQEMTFQTHHTLMNYLHLPLDDIYRARLKLEGIGLLKTYRQEKNDQTCYLYELQRAFSPAEFFADEMLVQLLYHHMDATKFNFLREHYTASRIEGKGTNVTASFGDVFQTIQPFSDEVAPSPIEQDTPQHRSAVDFSWLEQMLKQRMIPVNKVVTAHNKRIIEQMMTLYDLAMFEVEKAVLWALTEENILDVKEFKEACHDIFQSKHQGTIKLTEKNEQPQAVSEYKPTTKEEQLIANLEKISPKQLLEDLSNGGRASGQDMKVISEVMTTQGLPSPVMNVLIHYVLLQSNMKLSRAYLEKIASHWSRANLQTAKEAMAFAKNEKLRYQNRKNYKQTYKKTTSTNEVVPDWFKERKKNTTDVQKNNAETDDDNEELAALLREFSNQNKN